MRTLALCCGSEMLYISQCAPPSGFSPGRLYGCGRQQPKGGDPVSHCHSPRTAAWSWIFASAEVQA
jgi:hypothetical protein